MRFYANDRIALLIELRRAAERLHGNVVFLYLLGGSVEVLLAHIRQDVSEVRRSIENPRSQYRLEFVSLFGEIGGCVHGPHRDEFLWKYTQVQKCDSSLIPYPPAQDRLSHGRLRSPLSACIRVDLRAKT